MSTRTILPALLFLAPIAASAQGTETTVSTGPGYADEVYYNLLDGVVGTAPIDEWDIGFQISGFSGAIITNGGIGVHLYNVPGADAEDFGSPVDTVGISSQWDVWYNSADTWERGAFNMEAALETGNLGWGDYSTVTHQVTGSTLFVIVLPDGSCKQMVIESLAGGVYTFSYADLDGSNAVTTEIKKADFNGRNFGYYSIREGKSVDHEPESIKWDLVFGKYIAWVGPNSDIPYSVTGVRTNIGASTARIVSSDPAGEPAPADEAYTESITAIGHDWKEYNGAWTINDETAYFVKDITGRVYRLVFTGFGGSGTGDFTFEKEEMSVSSVELPNGTASSMELYPNSVRRGDLFSVVYSLEQPAAEVRVTVVDGAGRVIMTETGTSEAGLHRIPMELNAPAGVYHVLLDVDGARIHNPVIIH